MWHKDPFRGNHCTNYTKKGLYYLALCADEARSKHCSSMSLTALALWGFLTLALPSSASASLICAWLLISAQQAWPLHSRRLRPVYIHSNWVIQKKKQGSTSSRVMTEASVSARFAALEQQPIARTQVACRGSYFPVASLNYCEQSSITLPDYNYSNFSI